MCGELFVSSWLECVRFVQAREVCACVCVCFPHTIQLVLASYIIEVCVCVCVCTNATYMYICTHTLFPTAAAAAEEPGGSHSTAGLPLFIQVLQH